MTPVACGIGSVALTCPAKAVRAPAPPAGALDRSTAGNSAERNLLLPPTGLATDTAVYPEIPRGCSPRFPSVRSAHGAAQGRRQGPRVHPPRPVGDKGEAVRLQGSQVYFYP